MPRTLKPCGTRAAYLRHLAADETPCPPCAEANRARGRQQRRARPPAARKLQPCGTQAAYLRHLSAGEDPCESCVEARRAAKVEYNHGRKAPGPAVNPPGPSTRDTCGTVGGYASHRWRAEATCQPCRDAQAAYSRTLHAATTAACGTVAAARGHRVRGETCETCRVTGVTGRTPSKPHGTAAAVRRHEYHREPCCEQCLPVQRRLTRERRARRTARRQQAA